MTNKVHTWLEDDPSTGLTLIRTYADHQSILDDNARAREMGRTVDSALEPMYRYHPTMVDHWLQEDGMSPSAWRKLNYKEKMAFIDRFLQSRDYRKLMRRHQKGMPV